MNRSFSDSELYGGGLPEHCGYRGSSKVARELLSRTSQGKPETSESIYYFIHRSSQGGRLSIGFLPTQLEEALSRRESLLGTPPKGATAYAPAGGAHYKPATPSPSSGGEIKIQRGIKQENPEPLVIINVIEEEEDIAGAEMAANNVQGGQLSAIPVFTGTRGLDALTYAEAIDGTIPQFGWTQQQAAQAAATRGGPAVANWLRGEKAAGITYNSWSDNAGNNIAMRPAFIIRFGPVYTTSGAVSAISDLKQRSGENVASFMDRVKVAVSMLHYNVAEADRNAAFREQYARLVVAQFGSGLTEELRSKVFGVPNPPATIAGVLAAATAAEAERNPTGTKLVIGAIEGEESSAQPTKSEGKEEDNMVERIVAKVEDVLAISRRQQGANSRNARTRGQSRSNYSSYKCYNCGQMGHLRRQCSRPQTPFVASRGRGHGTPFNTRRGRFRQNFGPSRAGPAFPNPGHGRGIYDVYAHDPYAADFYYHGEEPGLYQENPWSSGNDQGEWL